MFKGLKSFCLVFFVALVDPCEFQILFFFLKLFHSHSHGSHVFGIAIKYMYSNDKINIYEYKKGICGLIVNETAIHRKQTIFF